MSKKVALGYVRVSTDEQAREGLSLDAQKEQLIIYARLRGYDLEQIFVDEGVSGGRTLSDRPAGAALLQRLKAGGVSVILAYKLDRLFRNTLDCLDVVQHWHKGHISLHLVDMGGQAIDTSSAMGRFFLTVMAGVAEMERNLMCERVLSAMRYKIEHGEFTGEAPYGFGVAEDGKMLVEDDQEQEVIERIINLRRSGLSIRAIAAKLNDENWPARGKCWHRTSVHRIVLRLQQDELV